MNNVNIFLFFGAVYVYNSLPFLSFRGTLIVTDIYIIFSEYSHNLTCEIV